MSLRDRLLSAARRATEVLSEANSKARVTQDGYTRIDPVALAERSGVAVMARPMERLLGAFIREAAPGILLNIERPVGMLHMTCAHELGHFFLGHVSTADEQIDYASNADVQELEADQFAYSLLTPRWLVAHVMRLKGWGPAALEDPAVVYQLSLRLGISYTGTVWSLSRLKLFATATAKRLAAIQPKLLKEAALPRGVAIQPQCDVWLLDPRDKECVLEPRHTDRFVVRLPSHATAGYLWSAASLTDAGFTLSPVLVDARDRGHAHPARVGAAGDDFYLLDSTPGTSKPRDVRLRLQEAQPWGASDSRNDEFELAAQFETLTNGLSEGSRRQAVMQLSE